MSGGHTKIMATLTWDNCREAYLRRLYDLGVRGVRINSAHVDVARMEEMVGMVRLLTPELKILMDTKGPELRITDPAGEIALNAGDAVEIARGAGRSTSERLLVDVDADLSAYQAGGRIEIDDGRIVVKVESVGTDIVGCRVERGGVIDSRKTLSMPEEMMMSLPAITERDRGSIAAGCRGGIDMIAHSFVRSAGDVEAVRRLTSGTGIEIYAKIECRAGVERAEEICGAADGLLVARGDLGSQIALSSIPVTQLKLMRLSGRMGKGSIIATQILESTLSRTQPTRSDLSDVALGVMEGADWLLLCNETARRKDVPEECIGWMRGTIEDVERNSLRCLIG